MAPPVPRSKPSRLLLLGGLAALVGLVGWWIVDTGEGESGSRPAARVEAPAEEPEPPADPVLAGRVVDRDAGSGVAGARVIASCSGGDHETIADARGRWGLPDVVGACAVRAELEGYVAGGPSGGRPLEVEADAAAPQLGLRLLLSRAAHVSGKVTDGREPVGGVTLTVVYLEAPGEADSFSVTFEAATDSRGRFDLPALLPGRLQLLAEHARYGFTETEDFYVSPGERRPGTDIVMSSSGAIAGVVVDDRGRAVPGAKVRIFADGARRARTVIAGPDGDFAVDGVAAGDAALVASAVGHDTSERVAVTVEIGEEAEVTLRLAARPGFGGLVLGPDGQPAARASVYAFSADAAELHGRRRVPVARTDEAGRFHIATKLTYPAQVWADHRSYDSSEDVTVYRDGDEVTLRLRPGTRLFGRVVDEVGRPVTAYHVRIRSASHGHRSLQMFVEDVRDADGRFDFESVAPGEYSLTFKAPGMVPLSGERVSVPEGTETDAGTFVLRGGGRAIGRVIDAATGEGIALARVSATLEGDHYRRPSLSARTDPDGYFEIDGLPETRLSLQFDKAARGQVYVRKLVSGVEVPAGGVADVGVIALEESPDGRRGHMQYSGMGARVQMTGDGLLIAAVFDGSPAAEVGLQSGTTVLAINDQDTTELSLRQAVELIRGESGTALELEILPPGSEEPQLVSVVRGEVTTK